MPSQKEGLTPAQAARFEADGFLHIPGFYTAEAVAKLRARAGEIIEGFQMEAVSVFSTGNQTKTTDKYFLDSGGKSSCFFEEGAFDASGTLIKDKHKAINKIGHGMHDVDPVFEEVSYTPELLSLARSLGLKKPAIAQSMYIFKQPHIGGKVDAHQDGTFIDSKPASCTGFWIALEDANLTNGCLWALPGSHKKYPITSFFVRDAEKGGPRFAGHTTEWDLSGTVPLEVKSGDLVLLHGGSVHLSHENKSPVSRHAYTLHLIELEGTEWPADNWLQRPADMPFREIEKVLAGKA